MLLPSILHQSKEMLYFYFDFLLVLDPWNLKKDGKNDDGKKKESTHISIAVVVKKYFMRSLL